MKSMHFASICTGNRRRASLLNLRIVYGQITSADAAWSQLQVWRDLNQDGISQSNELSTLAGLNITRIGLNGSGTLGAPVLQTAGLDVSFQLGWRCDTHFDLLLKTSINKEFL